MKFREIERTHPAKEIVIRLGVVNHRAFAFKYGNELDYGFVPGLRVEYCLSCRKKIRRNRLAFGVYKYRYSQGYQCGRWHPQCIRNGIREAKERIGFCWLTGKKNVPVKYMPTTKAQRFSATEEALLEWVKEFEQCNTPNERAITRYKLRRRQLPAIFQYHFDKADPRFDDQSETLGIDCITFSSNTVVFDTTFGDDIGIPYSDLDNDITQAIRKAAIAAVLTSGLSVLWQEFWSYIKAESIELGQQYLKHLQAEAQIDIKCITSPPVYYHTVKEKQFGLPFHWILKATDKKNHHDALGYAEFQNRWPTIKTIIRYIEQLPVEEGIEEEE